MMQLLIISLDITQHPTSDTFCEGTNAVLSCVVFDNSTDNAADATSWFRDSNNPVRLPDNMINNTRDGDVVTSVLTIENVSLNDNGDGYFCLPSARIESYVGVISVAGGEYVYYLYRVQNIVQNVQSTMTMIKQFN